MLREKEGAVAFGSTLDRKLFPLHVPPNRSGNEHRLRGAPHLGPGTYNNHEMSSFVYETIKAREHVESNKGYSLGARTARRFPDVKRMKTFPGPGSYQHKTSLTIGKPSAKPFGAASTRFPEISQGRSQLPGAGTYEHEVELNKKVEFMGSFGGPQILKWKNGVLNETAIQRVFGTRQSKIVMEKDLKKQLCREAYLSLYWG